MRPAPRCRRTCYSRTLPEGTRDGVTVVRDGARHVRALKAAESGKPLWLWGGGTLFRDLAHADLVDGVDVAILPILLGGGLPLLPSPGPRLPLTLRSQRLYPKTGTLFVEYDVVRAERRSALAHGTVERGSPGLGAAADRPVQRGRRQRWPSRS